jgi:hypothetical protein
MLPLDDPQWRELDGGYRVPYDASQPLTRLEAGEDVWKELWTELHHQGDLGLASYAAVPQLVRITANHLSRDWNLYALVATIEIERHRKTNPPLPSWLELSYRSAWNQLLSLALRDLSIPTDDLTVRSALSVIALAHHERPLGALLHDIEGREIYDYVEKRFAWSTVYAENSPH